jgi:hypothetical protein
MTRFQLIAGFILTIAITIVGGVLHGRLTGRWGASLEALAAAERLESLPTKLGSWQLEKTEELSAFEMNELEPYGHVSRVYFDSATGQRVSFFVVVGPVGKTAAHTPEICYSSQAYTMIDAPKPTNPDVEGHRKDALFAMTFRSNSLDAGLLRVYYGWSTGSNWEAPEEWDGRFLFARSPYLYKLQLSANLGPDATPDSIDPCESFLKDLLPVLRDHMVPARR